MPDSATEAIAVLAQRAARIRQDAENQAAELERVIDNLRSATGAPPPRPEIRNHSHHHDAPPIVTTPTSASSRISAKQFSGQTKSMALENYMRARRNDGRIPIANAVLDLLAGGCDLGAHGDRWERHVMAIARERPRVFGFDPDRREIWLAPTADDPPRPKSRGKGRKLVVAKSTERRRTG